MITNRLMNKCVSSPLRSVTWRRLITIQTLTTPNENALKFLNKDNELLQTRGSKSIVIKNTDQNLISHSDLASKIFAHTMAQIQSDVIDLLTQQLASGKNVISDEFHAIKEDNEAGYQINEMKFDLTEEDEEIKELIEELIETRIRPAILEDGGDIDFRGWDPESGTVYLKLQGACTSCSSSEVTLKYGIESMLKHYVDEVKEVIQMMDPEQEIALKEFDKLEKKLQSKDENDGTTAPASAS
ncbi:probable NifU-like protein, mitochondrial [Nakaseomyces glabratus]|nr:probable NifU-like protein, mitochondrial [Nakaseomyces glabratus]SLM13811.1 probable NifU-like protein, mitochondrial [Nakaseomyces glabratus]